MPQFYKSKRPIMPLGILAIAVAVGIAGSILSFVYLKINQICPIVYLSILCALGFGALMGLIAYGLIKIMKIHSAVSGCIGIILGCLIFTVFKWALYVQWDYEKYYYEPAKDESAFTYYEFNYDFASYNGTGDESEASSYTLLPDDQLKIAVTAMQNMSMYDYAESIEGDVDYYLSDGVTEQNLKNTTAFDYFYDGYVKDSDVVGSIKKAYDSNIYEYYYEYLKSEPIVDVAYLVSHPDYFWSSIKSINKDGRWTYTTRSRYAPASSATSTEVKGGILWAVWIGELLMICIPAIVIAVKRAEKPFIEYEKKWAELNDSDAFMFKPPAIAAAAAQAIKADPQSLFAYERLTMRPGTAPYLKVQLYHSTDYSENYMNIVLRSYVPKNRNYTEKLLVKYRYVDQGFVYKLFQMCGQDIPFSYTPAAASVPGKMEEVSSPEQYFSEKPYGNAGEMDELVLPSASPIASDEKSDEDIYKELNN